jgi:hypothetical protein
MFRKWVRIAQKSLPSLAAGVQFIAHPSEGTGIVLWIDALRKSEPVSALKKIKKINLAVSYCCSASDLSLPWGYSASSGADPDPTYHFDADSDAGSAVRILIFICCGSGSWFLFDADPDPDFYLIRIRIRFFTLMRIRVRLLAGSNPWQSAQKAQISYILACHLQIDSDLELQHCLMDLPDTTERLRCKKILKNQLNFLKNRKRQSEKANFSVCLGV